MPALSPGCLSHHMEVSSPYWNDRPQFFKRYWRSSSLRKPLLSWVSRCVEWYRDKHPACSCSQLLLYLVLSRNFTWLCCSCPDADSLSLLLKLLSLLGFLFLLPWFLGAQFSASFAKQPSAHLFVPSNAFCVSSSFYHVTLFWSHLIQLWKPDPHTSPASQFWDFSMNISESTFHLGLFMCLADTSRSMS